jgi:phosphoglycolate phosphatase-like HAD superfamily hydrolase
MDAQDDVRWLSGEGVNVDSIAAVMFEPVGCLAEFPAEEFDAARRELFAAPEEPAANGSLAYWRLLATLDQAGTLLPAAALTRLEELELAAVERADLYEDVFPALERLKATGVNAHLVSSLSHRALARFVERFSLADRFGMTVARDDAGGVMARPLRHAIARAALEPQRVIYLVETVTALDMSRELGVQALLMINDYDEGRALAERHPAGGIVSIAELADALQLIEQRAGLRRAKRMPDKPFELFEPG